MTTKEREALLPHTKMKQFTFYLDDMTKLMVLQKLNEFCPSTNKGTISALIRVLLNNFASCTDTDFLECVMDEVQKEYLLTTKKNKRSTL